MKKFISVLLALVMAISVTTFAWADGETPERTKGYKEIGASEYSELPAAPTEENGVISVNAANAQYTLDGAYGDITGKTIRFTESITETLFLGRPTKYVGSNTKYYSDGAFTAEIDYAGAMAVTTNGHYIRTVSNVTFTAAAGVSVAGFVAYSGQVTSAAEKPYDYVRDMGSNIVTTNNGYYAIANLANITFDGLTITKNVDISGYETSCAYTVNGIRFVNCVFHGNAGKTEYAIRIAGGDATLSLTDLKVEGCTFEGCKEGVLAYHINGAVIKNNTFKNMASKAIELGSSSVLSGEIVIKENYIKDTGDRAIKLGNFSEGASLTVENNVMINAKDENGEVFKAEGKPSTISLEHNYWGVADVSTAVNPANGITAPTTTGIIGGTFTEEITSDMLAGGVKVVDNGDGTYTVVTEQPAPTPEPPAPVEPEQPAHTNRRYPATTTTTETPAKGNDITSAKTFDGGVALYVGMALTSTLGMAWMGKKRAH